MAVDSALRLIGRSVMLALACFLSLLVIVLDGSAGTSTTVNWVVPLLLVIWGSSAYLGHLRASLVRRGDSADGSGRRRLSRREMLGAGAAVAVVFVAAVTARTLADTPVIPLAFSVVLGAVVGLLASDILGRLRWLR